MPHTRHDTASSTDGVLLSTITPPARHGTTTTRSIQSRHKPRVRCNATHAPNSRDSPAMVSSIVPNCARITSGEYSHARHQRRVEPQSAQRRTQQRVVSPHRSGRLPHLACLALAHAQLADEGVDPQSVVGPAQPTRCRAAAAPAVKETGQPRQQPSRRVGVRHDTRAAGGSGAATAPHDEQHHIRGVQHEEHFQLHVCAVSRRRDRPARRKRPKSRPWRERGCACVRFATLQCAMHV
jgi:hypothetical protein